VSRPPLALERAKPADLDALVALERACFSHPWSPRDLEAAIADRDHGCVLVLRAVGAATGPVIVAYCIFQVVLDEMSVLDLAVDAQWRRQGIGRWLLERALSVAARRGASVALLEVRQSNWPALELYRTLGFEVISARRHYYERPQEDAFLLRKGGLASDAGGSRIDP